MEQLILIREDLGSIKTNMENLNKTLNSHIDSDLLIQKSQDARLSNIENKLSEVKGGWKVSMKFIHWIWVAIIAIASHIIAKITHFNH